ncbi:protein SPT2 homolog, partial [Contarinia nasturtii]|uniref:protein SPT2 homolog n=1 Tax=Contarinia nasturtii TaxID=265458 RepID=UPI0012D474AB
KSKFYSTKFNPPKKESRDKKLSDGIKRYLAKKEEEQRVEKERKRQKYERFMALRSDADKKENVDQLNQKRTSNDDGKKRRPRKNLYDPKAEREAAERKTKMSHRPPPPAMDYNALLKLAEVKQHETVQIVAPKRKKSDRPMTEIEKQEMEERMQKRNGLVTKSLATDEGHITDEQPNSKKPKLNAATLPKQTSSTTNGKKSSGSASKALISVNKMPKTTNTVVMNQFKISSISMAKPNGKRPNDNDKRSKSKCPSKNASKLRCLFGDTDSEYDSDMDDFIEDDEEANDYSKEIRNIFGYDKRRYRYEDDDISNMESSYAQQQREEFVSKKIGLMEDLEDMQQEAEEKKRK